MKKEQKYLLIGAGVLVAAWLAWKWWQGRQAGQAAANNNGGAISNGQDAGSNLNSVAPDLVAGATAGGTTAGPGASIPVNVTVNQEAPAPAGAVPMLGVNALTPTGVTVNGGSGTMTDDTSDQSGDNAVGSLTSQQAATMSTQPVSSGS